MILKDIVDIKVGYTFRGKIHNEDGADTVIIQLRDINYNLNTINRPSTFINSKKFKSNHFIESGDILFVAKGYRRSAVLYDSNAKAIATSVFFIIKVNHDIILPEYLVWFLNNRESQEFFDKMKTGTTTLNIKKEVLQNMEIEVPSMETQNKIVRYNQLSQREFIIMDKIKKKKKALNEQLMLNLIK